MGGQCPPAPSAPTPLGLVWFLYRHIDSLQWPPHIIQIWKLPLLSSLKIIDEISGPKAFFYCIVNVGLVYSGGEFLLSIHEASCWKVFYLKSLVERKYFCRNLKFETKECKVRIFWEAHIIWKKYSSGFWCLLSKSADLSNSRGGFFSKFCVFLRKFEL